MTTKRKDGKTKPTAAQLDAAADRLAHMEADRALIPGIYNYCDRWCERCPQTARCLNFKMEQARTKQNARPAANDLRNREFRDDLAEVFALTLHMVRRDAKRLGIDLDSPEVMAAIEAEQRSRRRRAACEGSGLHRAARAYTKSAQALLGQLPAELQATEDALNTQVRLGAGTPRATAVEIREALEVVQWYVFFIEVKLARATAGRVDEAVEGGDGFPSDAEGSAKVALVAIDRSLAAWGRLRRHLDGEADAILDLLVQLERLRRAVESKFPQARAFKRPGFD